MKNSLLLFLALNSIVLVVSLFTGGISLLMQLALATLLIAVVGIPHGAIDHILYLQSNKTSPIKFYALYFSLILLVILVWIFVPLVGLILFLGLSAYHFGQSQFARYTGIRNQIKFLLYSSWGVAVLSGLCVFNQAEILSITSSASDLLIMKPLFEGSIFHYLLFFGSISFGVILVYYRKLLGIKTILFELLIFMLIQVSFFLNPLLVGFSIYFASLHSLHVLHQEFNFLSKRMDSFNWQSFVLLLLPYASISIFGLAVILALSHYGFLEASKTFLVFVAISALTLPHSLVMERFYSTTDHLSN